MQRLQPAPLWNVQALRVLCGAAGSHESTGLPGSSAEVGALPIIKQNPPWTETEKFSILPAEDFLLVELLLIVR